VFEGSFGEVFSSVVSHSFERRSPFTTDVDRQLIYASSANEVSSYQETSKDKGRSPGRWAFGSSASLFLYRLTSSMTAVSCRASFLITSSFCSVIEHPASFLDHSDTITVRT
jgi:hypothetical protein